MDRIIAEPRVALDAISRQQSTFTARDLVMFAHRHSLGKEQFDQTISAVRSSPQIVSLGTDPRGRGAGRPRTARRTSPQRSTERPNSIRRSSAARRATALRR
jgi:hypothetical protein